MDKNNAFVNKNDGRESSSSGYYMDADKNKYDANTPRVRQAAYDAATNKFVWPTVRYSVDKDVKIAYACFSDAEKALYKEFRSHDGTGMSKSDKAVNEALDKLTSFFEKTEMADDVRQKGLQMISSLRPVDKAVQDLQNRVKTMSAEDKAALRAALGL